MFTKRAFEDQNSNSIFFCCCGCCCCLAKLPKNTFCEKNHKNKKLLLLHHNSQSYFFEIGQKKTKTFLLTFCSTIFSSKMMNTKERVNNFESTNFDLLKFGGKTNFERRVKPVHNDHHLDSKIVAVVDSWSLLSNKSPNLNLKMGVVSNRWLLFGGGR